MSAGAPILAKDDPLAAVLTRGDPYAAYGALRARGPVLREAASG